MSYTILEFISVLPTKVIISELVNIQKTTTQTLGKIILINSTLSAWLFVAIFVREYDRAFIAMWKVYQFSSFDTHNFLSSYSSTASLGTLQMHKRLFSYVLNFVLLKLTSPQGPLNHSPSHSSVPVQFLMVSNDLPWSHFSFSTFLTPSAVERPQKIVLVSIPLPHLTEHCENTVCIID